MLEGALHISQPPRVHGLLFAFDKLIICQV
jgi:hypothetical protein